MKFKHNPLDIDLQCHLQTATGYDTQTVQQLTPVLIINDYD